MLRPIRPFSASANLRGFPLCPLFFALRPCLSSQSLGSSSAVLLFSQPSRCSFLASHFPQRISLLLRLLLLRSAVCLSLSGRGAWRFRSAIRSAATSPQRFPLAVSYALRPSASLWRFLSRFVPALSLWRFLSRFVPALSLGGFSLASPQRFPLPVSYALRPSASLWRFLSLRPSAFPWRFFPRLRRFVLCSCRRRGSPTIKPGGDERMCDGLPNAAETIERLARESERLSIELQAVKQENEALKAKISELEKKLETA